MYECSTPCLHGVLHRVTQREWALIKASEGVLGSDKSRIGYQVSSVATWGQWWPPVWLQMLPEPLGLGSHSTQELMDTFENMPSPQSPSSNPTSRTLHCATGTACRSNVAGARVL